MSSFSALASDCSFALTDSDADAYSSFASLRFFWCSSFFASSSLRSATASALLFFSSLMRSWNGTSSSRTFSCSVRNSAASSFASFSFCLSSTASTSRLSAACASSCSSRGISVPDARVAASRASSTFLASFSRFSSNLASLALRWFMSSLCFTSFFSKSCTSFSSFASFFLADAQALLSASCVSSISSMPLFSSLNRLRSSSSLASFASLSADSLSCSASAL